MFALSSASFAAVASCALGLAVHLIGAEQSIEPLRIGGKIGASLAMIAFAFFAGATAAGAAGLLLLLALTLSLFGDALLLGRAKPFFLAGLSSFLLAHLAYLVLFLQLGVDRRALAWATPVVLLLALAAGRWLSPHAGPLRPPLFAYLGAISAMMVAATGAAGAPGGRTARLALPVAALVFAISDLFVARERFVTPSRWNKRIGLPLYYAAQLAFGWAVAAA